MTNNTSMKAMDTISGALATAYVTIGKARYNLMQLVSFEASMETKLAEVAILGRTGKGNKPAGWSGSWKGTAHYNQSIFREMMLEYKKTGQMPEMTIQITNDDPTSAAGKQTVILYNCLTKGGVLAKFDADAETLDEDIEGTFDDWDMKEKFTMLAGMKA